MTKHTTNPLVFFDIDGTLHQQDLLVCFMIYAFKKHPIIWALLPCIIIGLIIYVLSPKSKLGINFIFYGIFFGINSAKMTVLIDEFYEYFYNKLTIHTTAIEQLQHHLQAKHTIVLITGNVAPLIKRFYQPLLSQKQVILIASTWRFGYFSCVLDERCFSHHKLTMLDKHFKKCVYFTHGYSDSPNDLPILNRCLRAFWVKNNTITSIKPA